MASFRKRGKSWEAFVAKNGVRKSATFDTKAKTVNWAARTETEILQNKHGSIPDDKSFSDLLTRYRDTGNCQPSCRLTVCDYAAILCAKLSFIFSPFSAIC